VLIDRSMMSFPKGVLAGRRWYFSHYEIIANVLPSQVTLQKQLGAGSLFLGQYINYRIRSFYSAVSLVIVHEDVFVFIRLISDIVSLIINPVVWR
jgi:hypothetical protein